LQEGYLLRIASSMQFSITTYGCQMNKADSSRLVEEFETLGWMEAASAETADLVVVNSCVVRQSAENRALSKIGSLRSIKQKRPNVRIALAGCMVDGNQEDLAKRFPHVDFFLKPAEWDTLLDWARGYASNATRTMDSQMAVSAFIPIIQGCDNFCTYCIVPYRRGRERSRSIDEILCEAEGMVARGTREITLLGQNVDSYGHDLPDKPELADLLERLDRQQGLKRIRFLTSHPKDMSQRLIETVARLDKVCEQINLPVQAGDDAILNAMRRNYTVAQYRELIQQIREAIPNIALSTDVIVGFPGESEAQYQATYDLLAELRFDTVHVAAYSPRQGTIAARLYEDDVPWEEKKRRLDLIEALQEDVASEINQRLKGTNVEVLVEEKHKGKWRGRTRSGKLVFFEDENDWTGKLAMVRVASSTAWSLLGERANHDLT
jgi:tRNA-2-methylthio-N6-dimethylallyladenosine synthase